MSAQGTSAARSNAAGASRVVAFIRAGFLFALGVLLALTAAMHRDVAFDGAVTATAIAMIAVVSLVSWAVGGRRGPLLLLQCAVGIAATVVLLFADTTVSLTVTIAAWALVSGLLEFIGRATAGASFPDGTLMGALGVLLAVATLLVRDDQVAAVGFFGAYATVAGVFLGISAFDRNRVVGADPAAAKKATNV